MEERKPSEGFDDFAAFVEWSRDALERLADIQKATWVRLENGRRQCETSFRGTFRYSFDRTDDSYMQDDMDVRFRRNGSSRQASAVVVFVTETEVELETDEDLGNLIGSIEVRSDTSGLLKALAARLEEAVSEPGQVALTIIREGVEARDAHGEPPECRDAVAMAESQPLSFVWGPPGTGKTFTQSLIAERFVREGKSILMVSGANVAVDEATKAVGKRLRDMPVGTVVRLGNPRDPELDSMMLTARDLARHASPDLSRRESELTAQLKTADPVGRVPLEEDLKRVRRKLRDREREVASGAAFLSTTLARASIDPLVYGRRYDVVLYDEVGMTKVPEVAFAATLASEHLCCFGDFRQLPPIVDDGVPELKVDPFEWLGITQAVERGSGHGLLAMLSEQHRCHSEIARFVGDSLYGGRLTTATETEAKTTAGSKRFLPDLGALAMVDLSGMPALALKDSGSHFNALSAAASIGVALSMPSDWDVAVIAPYKSQALLMRSIARDLGVQDRIRCATVHSFQGSQADAVVFDVVDCAPGKSLGVPLRNVEYRAGDRLLNVAMTRAKNKFVLVANVDGMRLIYPQRGLMLRRLMDELRSSGRVVSGVEALRLATPRGGLTRRWAYERADVPEAWSQLLSDIDGAGSKVTLLFARSLSGDIERVNALAASLDRAAWRGARIELLGKGAAELPPDLHRYRTPTNNLPNTSMAFIDDRIVWNGTPCSWLKDHNGRRLAYDPAFRLEGGAAVREFERIYAKKKRNALREDETKKGQGVQTQLPL